MASIPASIPDDDENQAPSGRLFWLGLLTLFLELLLIRNIAGNSWNLGYFPNLVLMAAFVGMGGGYLFHRVVSGRSSRSLLALSTQLLLLLFVSVAFFRPAVPGLSDVSGYLGGELFFTNRAPGDSAAGLGVFLVWFLAVFAIFALVSQRTAKVIARLAPLRAYTFDIAGSCCGIIAFKVISWFRMPDWLWVAAAIPLFVLDFEPSDRRHRIVAASTLAVAAALVLFQDVSATGTVRGISGCEV